MATVTFYGGLNFAINNLGGSGVGFYQDNFGGSVPVGSWNNKTYITDSNGVIQGAELSTTQYVAGSAILNGAGSGIGLVYVPNYQCPLNIRFNHDTAVQVNNVTLRIYDRVNTNNAPSGLTCAVAEAIHTDTSQSVAGSGDTEWTFCAGSAVTLSLAQSPGCSGAWAGNGQTSTHSDTQHDHYVMISTSPNSIGSKTQFGLYVEYQYV